MGCNLKITHINHQKTKKLIVSVRESGREDFFLLLAFLIKEWRVNEIERKRERRAFWAWHSLDHQNHSSIHSKGISGSLFFFFVFIFLERGGGKKKKKKKKKS